MDIKEVHEWQSLPDSLDKTMELENRMGLKTAWYLNENRETHGIDKSYVVGFKGEYDDLELIDYLQKYEEVDNDE